MALTIVLLRMLASARRLAASTSGSSGILFEDRDHKTKYVDFAVALINNVFIPLI